MSRDEKIARVAYKVREVAEALQVTGGWSKTLCGACGISSYFLAKELRALGYRAEVMWNSDEGHCWVEIGEQIIDVTATQYGVRHRIYRPQRDRSRIVYHRSEDREVLPLHRAKRAIAGWCTAAAWRAFAEALRA